MSLPSEVLAACQQVVGSPLQRALPVSGGDINEAYRLESARGQVFLKLNRTPQAQAMFEAEAQGLALLAAPGALAVPLVLGTGAAGLYAFLLLEYVHEGARGQDFWQAFGAGLAELHRTPQAGFGLDHDNFIGSLPQRNRPHPDWPSFYAAERLLPQLELARSQGLLQQGDEQQLSRLCARLPELCPDEPPALIHGDLWSGNFLAGSAGQPFLIDPAACYAHREMDLAMSRLFGGFAPEFYRAYHEAYPLAPGLEERLEAYQLYYLLVHVNLFGQSYVPGVRRILKTYT
jgi:protein-ribulosamine 3-kinase